MKNEKQLLHFTFAYFICSPFIENIGTIEGESALIKRYQETIITESESNKSGNFEVNMSTAFDIMTSILYRVS